MHPFTDSPRSSTARVSLTVKSATAVMACHGLSVTVMATGSHDAHAVPCASAVPPSICAAGQSAADCAAERPELHVGRAAGNDMQARPFML